jgi:hypothetical protein
MIRKVISYQLSVISFFAFLFLAYHLPLTAYNYCYAREVISSTELIQNAQMYDGKEVVYEGEVVGEVMHRRDGVWVNINDGESSIGVWMTPELAAVIKYRGSYKAEGDILKIRGIFNRTCVQHGGDLDIHATHLTKTKSGWLKQERIIPAKRDFLIILIVILCLILILRISIIR